MVVRVLLRPLQDQLIQWTGTVHGEITRHDLTTRMMTLAAADSLVSDDGGVPSRTASEMRWPTDDSASCGMLLVTAPASVDRSVQRNCGSRALSPQTPVAEPLSVSARGDQHEG